MYTRAYIAAVLFFFAAITLPDAASAADWDRFPELPGRSHVGIKKRFDGPRYDDLRRCLRGFDSRVDAEYYGALVDVTAESGSRSRKHDDAGPYAKALYEEAWSDRLDDDEHVLMVIGIRNRSIGVHAGERWRLLGFDGQTVDGTIEASPFEDHLGRRNYVEALCSLARSIDFRLASLQKQMEQRVEETREGLPKLEERVAALRTRLEDDFPPEHPVAESLREEVAEAEESLEKLKEGLEEEPSTAVSLADDIDEIVGEVKTRLADYDVDMETLGEFEEELAALRTTIEERADVDWEGPQAALSKLDECQDLAEEIRRKHEKAPWKVRACISEAEAKLGAADVRYDYLAGILPTVVVLALAALLVWFVIARFFRRRRASKQLDPELREWERRIHRMTDRLLDLEAEYPVYFEPRETPWEGASAELDQQTANAVNLVFLLHREARSILEEARSLKSSSMFLGVRKLEKALSTLRDTDVTLTSGAAGARRRLSLPMTESYQGRAAQLLGDLVDSWARTRDRLAEVEEVRAALEDASQNAGEAASRATSGVAERRELGLNAEKLEAQLHDGLSTWKEARLLSRRDPVTATERFLAAATALENVAERAEKGNRAVRGVHGPIDELGRQLRSDLRRLRARGSKLAEPGFAPESTLESAAIEAERVEELVERGRDAEAESSYDALQAELEELRLRLDVCQEAADFVPQIIEALDEEKQRLDPRIREARMGVSRLSTKQPSEEIRETSVELGAIRRELGKFDQAFAKIRQEHTKGNYLSAVARVGEMVELVSHGYALLDEAADLEERVGRASAEVPQRLEQTRQLASQVGEAITSAGVPQWLRDVASEQTDALREIAGEAAAERPAWLDLERRVEAVQAALTAILGEVEAEAEAYREAVEQTRRIAERVGGLNASVHPELVAAVKQRVSEWSARVQERQGSGRALRAVGLRIAEAVSRAEEVVTRDLDPVHLAEARLGDAVARYTQVHGRDYGFGVEGDCGGAAATLEDARAALGAGDVGGTLVMSEAALEVIESEDVRARTASDVAYRRDYLRTLGRPSPRSEPDASTSASWNAAPLLSTWRATTAKSWLDSGDSSGFGPDASSRSRW